MHINKMNRTKSSSAILFGYENEMHPGSHLQGDKIKELYKTLRSKLKLFVIEVILSAFFQYNETVHYPFQR